MLKHQRTITESISYWGDRLIIAAILLEMALFFSLPNLAGCFMTLVSWVLFKKIGLNVRNIEQHFFPWLVFLSMSMYRILPLVATLMEGKPVSYCFKVPFETFFGETLLYAISVLAFWLVARDNTNNVMKRFCKRIGLYRQLDPIQMWVLGFMGLAISLFVRGVEMGDAAGKFLQGFAFVRFAPFMISFPSLWNIQKAGVIYERDNKVIAYFILLTILTFSGNSRYALIEPSGTVFLLFFISIIRTGKPLRYYIKPKYAIGVLLGVFIIVPALSDVSTAMLAVRGIRSNVSSEELFERTWDTFWDKEKLRKIDYMARLNAKDNLQEDWNEGYLDNFALNRYCNMRITDVAMYNGERAVEKYGRKVLQDDLVDRSVRLLPTPALNALGLDATKTGFGSRGDLLKALSSGQAVFVSLLVTSHLGDGIATFGYFYFIIQFLLFYVELKLIDTFSYMKEGKVIYSVMGLVVVFSFLGQFRNANGCMGEISYILRGFWQDLLLFAIALKVVSLARSR